MSDFRDVFDVSTLEEHELGHIEFVLNSPSYTDVFEPYLIRMRSSLNQRLLNRSQKRKEEMPDDYIAGGIAMIDGLTIFFRKLIEETRMENIARSQSGVTTGDEYDRMRATGASRPAGQMAEPPEEYDPAQDF